jgi:hypothetical protein
MRITRHRRRRLWVALIGSALCATLVGSASLPASAAVPAVVSRNSKVVTADGLPTAQINGVVTTQVVAGTTVYAGGTFTAARPAGAAPGTQEVARYNLLAYNITTGVLTAFAPQFNGPVKALALRKDKKVLYVGGNFTKVGTATRNNFAAFTVSTGNLRATAPRVNGAVNAITVTEKSVYFGGNFTTVNGWSRTRLAAISTATTTGSLTAWRPAADDDVLAMTTTPDQTKIIAGGSFLKVNGVRGYGLVALGASDGVRKTWLINQVVRDYGPTAAVLSLTADNDTVYGAGYAYGGTKGYFEGAFAARPSDGKVRWLQDCHGDTYSVAPVGSVVYSVGHAHDCSNIGGFPDPEPRRYHGALAVTKAVAGTVAKNTAGGPQYGNFEGQPAPALYNWFPDLKTGEATGLSQAAWSVVGTTNYVAMGGEFTEVNGVPQQGLVRHALPARVPNREQGPMDRRPGTAPTISRGSTDGTAIVRWPTNWDRDERTLTYEVLRDDVVIHTVRATSVFWKRPVLQAADSGLSANTNYSYRVRVSDPGGNTVTSGATVFRNPPPNAYAATIDADGADHQWRFNSPAGTTSEPDLAGSANLSLANDVTLGGAGASVTNTGTSATLGGTNLSGSSTSPPETRSGQGSIEFWFRTAKTGGTLVAFGAADGVNTTANVRARELYLNGVGQLSFAVRRPNDTVKPFIAETGGSLADNQWHHVAAVQTNTALLLYIDGLEQAAAPATPLVSSTGRWWVGGRTPVRLPEQLGSGYKGQIDELSVFPTALTAVQVHRHYQLGVQ